MVQYWHSSSAITDLYTPKLSELLLFPSQWGVGDGEKKKGDRRVEGSVY